MVCEEETFHLDESWQEVILRGVVLSRTGVPNLQDLMPDDLRWSLCNNNRNKVHNKCNALESS